MVLLHVHLQVVLRVEFLLAYVALIVALVRFLPAKKSELVFNVPKVVKLTDVIVFQ